MLTLRYLLLLFLLSMSAWAVVDVHTFDTESQRQRYLTLIDELRCPKCQNQNLSGSDADIAADLRRELHRLLLAGKTDREIITFMVDRYGDFILYRPRLQMNTSLLWFAPGILLLSGGIILWRMTYRPKPFKVENLTKNEEEELKKLLHDKAKAHDLDVSD